MFSPIHIMVNKTKYLKATDAVYFTVIYWAASVTSYFDTLSACFSRNCPKNVENRESHHSGI